MEVETAVRRHLLDQGAITNLVQRRVWKFVLRLFDDDGAPKALEGSGLAAIVLKRRRGWTSPDMQKTSEFPLLVVECWADNSREEDGTVIKLDAEDRAAQLYREVDRILHLADGSHNQWPEGRSDALYIEGCHRAAEPDGPLHIDGAAVMRATYNVKTFH